MMWSDNKYLKVYQQLKLKPNQKSTPEEAAQVVRQLGHMYNAMGEVIKDFVKLLQPHYTSTEVGTQYEQQSSPVENACEMDIEQEIDFKSLVQRAAELQQQSSQKKNFTFPTYPQEIVDLDDSSSSIKAPMENKQIAGKGFKHIAEMEISTHGTNEITSRFSAYQREPAPQNNPVKRRKENKKVNQNLIQID